MNHQKLQTLFDDKYEKLLDMTYEEWLSEAPQTEEQAYDALSGINKEIEILLDAKNAAVGIAKDDVEDQLEFLRNQYTLIEDLFNLEAKDKGW